MANLLEQLRGNLAPKPQASEMDQTGQIQKLLQAKSGKAIGPQAAPRTSSLQEQVAVGQVQLAGQQQQTDQNMMAQQLQQQQLEQQQVAELSSKKLDEQQIEVLDDFTRKQEELLNQYSQNTRELDLNKDKANLEQLGFTMRLGNDKYISSLQREGKRSRLDNAAKFQDALAQSVFAEEQELFQNDLQFRQMISADKRSFMDDLANIDMDFALKMAAAENKAANSQMMWSGVGNLAGAGAKVYSQQQQGAFDSSEAPAAKPGGGE